MKLRRRESRELRASQELQRRPSDNQIADLRVPDGDARGSLPSERSARKSELSSVEDVASFAENQPTMDQDALMGHYQKARGMGSHVSGAPQIIESFISGV